MIHCSIIFPHGFDNVSSVQQTQGDIAKEKRIQQAFASICAKQTAGRIRQPVLSGIRRRDWKGDLRQGGQRKTKGATAVAE